MNTRRSILVRTFLGFSLLLAVGACVPASDPVGGGSGGKGSGGSGSGGSGSGGSGSGGAGSGGSGSGGLSGSGSGGADTPPATFATVSQVVGFYCGGPGCHGGGDTPPNIYGVSDAQLYTTLTTFTSTMCGNRLLVKAGAPQDSAFYRAQAEMCQPLARMPKGCVDACTPPEYLDAIRQWIANGAPRP